MQEKRFANAPLSHFLWSTELPPKMAHIAVVALLLMVDCWCQPLDRVLLHRQANVTWGRRWNGMFRRTSSFHRLHIGFSILLSINFNNPITCVVYIWLLWYHCCPNWGRDEVYSTLMPPPLLQVQDRMKTKLPPRETQTGETGLKLKRFVKLIVTAVAIPPFSIIFSR